MSLATFDVLRNVDLFRLAHPNWPGVSPGEYPLDLDGNVIPDEPESIFTRHPDWAVVITPPTPEDDRLYREAGWE
jgi:hypothetical protein